MPLIKSGSEKAFNHNVGEMVKAGHPQSQAVAAAYSTKAKALHKKHLAYGGMMEPGYDEGGEVSEVFDDHEDMLNHIALECMSAIESKDKELFKQSFHILVSDILLKLENEEDEDEPEHFDEGGESLGTKIGYPGSPKPKPIAK